MATNGISLTKDTQVFADRSKSAIPKEVLPAGTPLLITEIKYREGRTWLAVRALDEQRSKGYILEETTTQQPWLHVENDGAPLPLIPQGEGGAVGAPQTTLCKGESFHVIYKTGPIAGIYYKGKQYMVAGAMQIKVAEEWSLKKVVMGLALFACLMYGALVLAPTWFPPGRYPQILFFLPGIPIAVVVVPAIWGLWWVGEQVQRRM